MSRSHPLSTLYPPPALWLPRVSSLSFFFPCSHPRLDGHVFRFAGGKRRNEFPQENAWLHVNGYIRDASPAPLRRSARVLRDISYFTLIPAKFTAARIKRPPVVAPLTIFFFTFRASISENASACLVSSITSPFAKR